MIISDQDTIAAIATAQGLGGIGVIRVSGPEAINICDKVFNSVTGKSEKLLKSKGYTAHYGFIFSQGEYVDEVIATVYRNPHSYTGEDVVEISCHGGLYVTKKVLQTVLDNGARLAQPGEFTKRAFLNGKLGLTEAESVMDIISASGHSAAKIAQSARNGALYKRIDAVKEELLNLAAHLASWADYPEEDIENVEGKNVRGILNSCKTSLEELISTYDSGKLLREGIYTAIVGRPNVGKSTLMNCLSGCERSIVTDIPGTTRDIVEESVMLGDVYMRIADTAGIRDTTDKVEGLGVELAKQKMKLADIVLAVFDASSELTTDDLELINSLKEFTTIAVVNKTDLNRKIDTNLLYEQLHNVVELSAINNEGLEKLQRKVSEIVGLSKIDPSEGILANERQKDSAQKALESINEAIRAIDNGITFDAITVLVESSIEELLSLTGERVSEKVVDKVFEKFCVGK